MTRINIWIRTDTQGGTKFYKTLTWSNVSPIDAILAIKDALPTAKTSRDKNKPLEINVELNEQDKDVLD